MASKSLLVPSSTLPQAWPFLAFLLLISNWLPLSSYTLNPLQNFGLMLEEEFGTMHEKESPHNSAYSCLRRSFHWCVLRWYSGNVPLVHCAVPFLFFYMSPRDPCRNPAQRCAALWNLSLSHRIGSEVWWPCTMPPMPGARHTPHRLSKGSGQRC